MRFDPETSGWAIDDVDASDCFDVAWTGGEKRRALPPRDHLADDAARDESAGRGVLGVARAFDDNLARDGRLETARPRARLEDDLDHCHSWGS
jgi:hypothetical protein